jgi:Ca2+-binding RTX toxin-like protein
MQRLAILAGTVAVLVALFATGAYAAVKTGTDGKDNLFGTDGRDEIRALAGSDTVKPRAGNDIVFGGRGSDALFGQGGKDEVNGGSGFDQMSGGIGDDTMRSVDGEEDFVYGWEGKGDVCFADRFDKLQGCETVYRDGKRVR